jgi:hypothetical protein
MRGQYALRTQDNWLRAVSQMVDIQAVKVKEGAVVRRRAGYILPHPDSLTTIESRSTLVYYLLHTIRSHPSLVAFIRSTVTSTDHLPVMAVTAAISVRSRLGRISTTSILGLSLRLKLRS